MGGRLGWFVSYADQAHPKIVIVVLLHGGSRIISGPHASQIAGRIYHTLYERNYFVDSSSSPQPHAFGERFLFLAHHRFNKPT